MPPINAVAAKSTITKTIFIYCIYTKYTMKGGAQDGLILVAVVVIAVIASVVVVSVFKPFGTGSTSTPENKMAGGCKTCPHSQN